jgi:acetyl esterase/lipase
MRADSSDRRWGPRSGPSAKRSPARPAMPPVDPELQEPLRMILETRPSSMTPAMIAGDRARWQSAVLTDDELTSKGFFAFESQDIDGRGRPGEVSVLVLRSRSATAAVPVIFNIHGGGLVAGHNRSPELRGDLERAHRLGTGVVSVNYRLAPENPHPIPVEDCYAALLWLVARAEDFGLDPSRVVLSGASAGGGLVAGVTLMARDFGGPSILGQMLLGPMLDDRVETQSAEQMDGRGLWDSTSNRTGWSALLGDHRGSSNTSPYAAPARCRDLRGLPCTYVDVGAVEALRDESVAFASRICAEGGSAELHVWGGAFHSFDEWVPHARVSRAASAARLSWLERLIQTGCVPSSKSAASASAQNCDTSRVHS